MRKSINNLEFGHGDSRMGHVKAKIFYYIKRNIKLKDAIKICLMLIQFPVVVGAYIYAKLIFGKNRDTWLVGETGVDAKDNGLAFFSYLNKIHPDINSVYFITKDSKAANKVKKIGTTVQANSFRHKAYFMNSRYILSTHDGYSIPFKGVNWREFKIVYGWMVPKLKFVFLNHGVNKDDTVVNANYTRTRFDYHVTTTEAEYNEMADSRYGYPKGNIIKTGLARYDTLQNNRKKVRTKQQIVFMPTWRYYLADVSDEEFIKSNYYKTIYSFLHNSKLQHELSKNKVKLFFFPPHHEIQKRISLFELENTNIDTFDTEENNFAKIVLESKMVITDYSSVIFDFAYLYKRSVYFQFDLDEYRAGQYKEGYFKYDNDGFGPIVTNENDLILEIEKAIGDDFEVNPKYKKRIDRTFSINDNKNSERLFNILI